MVLALILHTKYPDEVLYATDLLLFLELSLEADLEAEILERRWDVVLIRNFITSFSNTRTLMV